MEMVQARLAREHPGDPGKWHHIPHHRNRGVHLGDTLGIIGRFFNPECCQGHSRWLSVNQISDISALSNLTGLDFLWIHRNEISGISIMSNFTKLYDLDISYNQISDIEPLVDNPGISSGDWVTLYGNPLSPVSIYTYIPQLEARGMEVFY